MSNNPQLLFVAGPNGAGKSTFSKQLSGPNAIIFDVDKVIARIEAQSPDMPKRQVYQAATQEFFSQAKEAVKLKQHFTLETNFRDQQLMDVVAEFKRFGYTTNMIYLTLDNIEQSIDRVNERVTNGGHYVDHKNIRQNYEQGLIYLEQFAKRFDHLEIIDASGPNRQLRSLLRVKQQKVGYLSDNLPKRVAKTVTAIADTLKPKNPLTKHRRPRH